MKKSEYRKNRKKLQKGGYATVGTVCSNKELQTFLNYADKMIRTVSTQERSRLTQEYPAPICGFKHDGAGVITLMTLLQTRLEADYFRKGWENWQMRIVALCICQQYAVAVDEMRFVKVRELTESFPYVDLRAPDGFQVEVYHDHGSSEPIARLDLYPWPYKDPAGDPAIHWRAPWDIWVKYSRLCSEMADDSDSRVINAPVQVASGAGNFISGTVQVVKGGGLSPITGEIPLVKTDSPRRVKGTNYRLADTGELIIGDPTDTNK